MEQILGVGNNLPDYLLVLLTYAGLFIAIRQSSSRIEPNFRKTFWLLYVVWGVGIFVGNYLFYLLGIMSFLPWLDNFIHSFIWIGGCLGFLYAISYKRPLWEQFVLFAVYSFVVKVTENKVLGTWELGRFFFIDGNLAYIIGWSVVDALYPLGSAIVLRIASRFLQALVIPSVNVTGSNVELPQ
jgi:hypothetical protein